MKIVVALGTRPEGIKLAPVVLALREIKGLRIKVINTGQHRDLSVQALNVFDITPDVNLEVMRPQQSLGQLTGRLFSSFDEVLEVEEPDWVIVQGDTTTAMVGALSAFYRRINVAHVEAGLRSFDISAPFPEEANRVFISHVATHNFPPTAGARENLLRLGVPDSTMTVTGNTVVDALRILRPHLRDIVLEDALGPSAMEDLDQYAPILVTSHRRESFGTGLDNICEALVKITQQFEQHAVFYPVHPNPQVDLMVRKRLAGRPRIHLIAPLGYLELLALMEKSVLVLTDSGGIQEEAPSFNKPILILRDLTERPEVVDVGAGRLVGTDPLRIFQNTAELLDDPRAYRAMADAGNPFGDGFAAQRIVQEIILSTN